jgi:phage terminase large subunit
MKKTVKHVTFPVLPTQWEFLNATEPEVLYSGSAGSGKSVTLCLKAIQQAAIPGNVALLVRKYLVNLKLSTLRTLLEPEGDRAPILPPGTYRHNRSEKIIHLYDGGDILYAGIGEEVTRLRSLSSGIVLVDEATELTEDEWDELHLRARIKTGTGQIMGATNPGDTAHWMYRRFIAPNVSVSKSEVRCIHGLSRDNKHLPATAQRALQQLKGAAGERMRDGIWIGLDRLIYGNYPAGCIAGRMPEPSMMQQWYISIDYGYSDPSFLLLAGVDGNGKLWIYNEKEQSKMLVADILAWLLKYKEREPIVTVDPSAAGLIAEIQSRGFTCIKATNDVKIGIDKTRDVMAAGMLGINAACTNLTRSLGNYVRKSDGTPDHADSHGPDSCRYLVMTAIGSRIEAMLNDLDNPPSNFSIFDGGDLEGDEEWTLPASLSTLNNEASPVVDKSPFLTME